MQNATDRAYNKVRTLILTGELVPGMQLKEEELAVRCGVSRTPVRDALRRLENEFYISRSDSQRSYVAKHSVEEISEIFTLRAMLEGYVAARAAERGGTELAERLRGLAGDEDDCDEVEVFLAKNSRFHAALLEAADSELMRSILPRLILQPIVYRTAKSYSVEQRRQSIAEHAEIVKAIAARDGEWARAVMTSHIRRAYHEFASAYDGAGPNVLR
jgi:DNA-binding GntR family transcriptional regulator